MKEPTKKTISLEEAKAQFEELLEELLAGKSIRISTEGKDPFTLSLKNTKVKYPPKNGKRVGGQFKGAFEMPTDEEWEAMDKEIEADFEASKLFPE